MGRNRDMGFNLRLTGLKELEKQLKELAKASTATKIMRAAATKAIRPMRKEAKAQCPVDSGALKKSIDSKVSAKNGHVSAIVGSDTNVMDDGKKAKFHDNLIAHGLEDKGDVGRAARRLHLVLFGHIDKRFGFLPGNNFLERAWQASISQCRNIYETELKAGIEKAAEGKG